jgi:DNA-directed RNA polymerase subunit RPC12/RpoP
MDAASRAPYAIGDDGHPDTRTVYLRCPHCTVLAVPLGLTYAPAGAGGISAAHPVEATCALCAADHTTTAVALAGRDAERRCARCTLTFAVPRGADEVVCPGCELHQPGPAALADPDRAAAVDRVRAAHLPAVRARLHARGQAAADEVAELPSYIDDPLVDLAAHRLTVHPDAVTSARVGHRARFGECSCGEWVTPSWDTSAVLEAHDQHMTEVQTAAHAARTVTGTHARDRRTGP